MCGIDENCLQNFGQKTERKIPLGRPRHRSEDNLKLVGWCVGVDADRLLWTWWRFFFLIQSQWLFAFCYVVSVMKFQVFWNITPCQLVNS
jgi:hypothetical protein